MFRGLCVYVHCVFVFLAVKWVSISRNVSTDITISRKCKKEVNFLTKEVIVLDYVVVLKAELFFIVLFDLNNLFTWFVLYLLLT